MPSTLKAPVIVVAPDSFKGSLSAAKAALAMERGILRAIPAAIVRKCPMADGGEGTLDALLSVQGSRQSIVVRNASGQEMSADVAELGGHSGIIEVAEIVGLTDSSGTSAPVGLRTTLGIGDAMIRLLDRGCRKITLALGGSSTNDAGAGMLVALGARLTDQHGNEVAPFPEGLDRVSKIDVSRMDSRLFTCSLLGMSDVENPLTGPNGATLVFGPQKGVLPEQAERLDRNLANFAICLESALVRQAAAMPASGAAGGLGFALRMLGGEVCSGAGMVADLLGFDELLVDADWVIAGEGRSDLQTLQGKAPMIVAERAHQKGVPTTLLSGSVDSRSLHLEENNFTGCFSIVPGPMSLERALEDAEALLGNAAEQITRLWGLGHV